MQHLSSWTRKTEAQFALFATTTSSTVNSMRRFAGSSADRSIMSFIRPGKRRSNPMPVGQKVLDLYDDLNRRFEVNKKEIASSTKPVRPKASRGPSLEDAHPRSVQPARQAGSDRPGGRQDRGRRSVAWINAVKWRAAHKDAK